jgi:hypothetical protein
MSNSPQRAPSGVRFRLLRGATPPREARSIAQTVDLRVRSQHDPQIRDTRGRSLSASGHWGRLSAGGPGRTPARLAPRRAPGSTPHAQHQRRTCAPARLAAPAHLRPRAPGPTPRAWQLPRTCAPGRLAPPRAPGSSRAPVPPRAWQLPRTCAPGRLAPPRAPGSSRAPAPPGAWPHPARLAAPAHLPPARLGACPSHRDAAPAKIRLELRPATCESTGHAVSAKTPVWAGSYGSAAPAS